MSTSNSNPKYAKYQVVETTLQDQIKKITYGSITLDEKVGQAKTMNLQEMGASLSNNPNLKNITNTPTFIQIEQNLSNPNLVKAQLAKFFWTLDFMPKDTYDAFFKTLKDNGIDINILSDYLRDPNAVLSDQNKLAQLYAIESILNEWQQKGYFKKTPDEDPMYNASKDLAKIGENWMERHKKRWEQIQKDIEQGKIPEYGGGASDTALNIFSKADIINDVMKGVEGSLGKGLSSLAKKLGANESVANEIAHDASMAVTGVILGLFPGVNALLVTDSIVDGITHIASSLDTPIEKQQLMEMLKDKSFWIDSAKDVALMAGGGLAGSALAEQVNSALVKRISQINPDLGAKLVGKVKVAEGTPIYGEQKFTYWVDPAEGKIYFRNQASGQLVSVSSKEIGKAMALFEDPQTGTRIANIIGTIGDSKAADSFLKTLNDLASWLGEDRAKTLVDTLSKMSPNELKGITTIGSYRPLTDTEVVNLGGRLVILTKDKPTATMLQVNNIPKNEFALYTLADETGLGTQTMNDILKSALAKKEIGILYKKETNAGDLVIASDGKTLKIALGTRVFDIPLNSISFDNWQKTLNIMQGLEKSVDPATYESVKEILRTQYGLTTPDIPPVYSLPLTKKTTLPGQKGKVEMGEYEIKNIFDIIQNKYGLKLPKDLQRSESASITAKINGKPFQLVLNEQLLGDKNTQVLINELTARQFNKSIFGKVGFTEDRIGVITVSRGAKYLEGAGTLDSATLDKAISVAGANGDMDAVKELTLLKQATKQIERGDVKPVLIGSSNDEITIVVEGAGAGSINTLEQKLQEATSKNDAQKLEEALKYAGVSESALKNLVVKVPKIIEKTVEKEVVIPVTDYETAESYSKDTIPDSVVKVPKVVENTVEREIVIPYRELETDNEYSKSIVPDTVVKVPKIIEIDREEQAVGESNEIDVADRYIVEKVPGTVIPVVIPIQVPLFQFDTIDVVEPIPPEPNPPPTPATNPPIVPPIPLPGMGGSFGPALEGAPKPRGKGEKEKLVI